MLMTPCKLLDQRLVIERLFDTLRWARAVSNDAFDRKWVQNTPLCMCRVGYPHNLGAFLYPARAEVGQRQRGVEFRNRVEAVKASTVGETFGMDAS